jgi:hypothetical protein
MAPGKGDTGKPYNHSPAGRGRAKTGVWLQDAPRTSGPLKPGGSLKPGKLESNEEPKEDQDKERSPRRASSGRMNPVPSQADSPPSPNPRTAPTKKKRLLVTISGAEATTSGGSKKKVHFVDIILIWCPNSQLGCHTTGPEDKIKRHAMCCDYQRLGCPAQHVDDIERCNYTGAAHLLEDHVRSSCAGLTRRPYLESTFHGSIRDNPFWKGEGAAVAEVPLPFRRVGEGNRAGTVFARSLETYWAPVLLEAPGLTNYRLFLLVVRSISKQWYLSVRSLNPLLGGALVTLEVYRSGRPVGGPVHTWSGPVSPSHMNNMDVQSSGQFMRLNDAQVHLLDTHQRWDQPPGQSWPGAKSQLDKDLQSLFEWTIEVHHSANLPWFRSITSLPQRAPSPPEPDMPPTPDSVGPPLEEYGALGRGGWMAHQRQDVNDPDYVADSQWQTCMNRMERKERERIAQNLALGDSQETVNSLVTTAQVEKGDDYPATGAKMKKREDLPANSPLGAKMKKREDLPANSPLVGKTGLGTRANPPRSRLDRPMNLQRRLQGLSLGGQRSSLGEEDLSSPPVTIPTLQPLPLLTPFPESMSSPASLEEQDDQEELGLFRPLRPPYEYREEMPVISYPSRRQGPEGEETIRGQLHQLNFEGNSERVIQDHAELDLQMHALENYWRRYI